MTSRQTAQADQSKTHRMHRSNATVFIPKTVHLETEMSETTLMTSAGRKALLNTGTPAVGTGWEQLVQAENSLAERLCAYPYGTMIVHGQCGWFLELVDGLAQLFTTVLEHGYWSEPVSRFDADMESIHIQADDLTGTVELVREVLEIFDTLPTEIAREVIESELFD